MEVSEYRLKNIFRQLYRKKSQSYLAFCSFIVLISLTAYAQAQSSVQTAAVAETGDYKIGVGDVLKILVLKQDILSQDNIRVGNEGTIRMPMIDDAIPAACLTEQQLSAEITNRYKKYLLNPQVFVTVKEFNAYPVAVIGAVNSPGSFKLQRPMRLLELLTRVNGPASNAGKDVQIFRDSSANQCGQKTIEASNNSATDELSQQEIISFSLAELMKGNEIANPFVQAGDIIRVTEAEVRQAFIIGNVKSPATINLKEPVTLSRAIAMAGGFATGAQTDKIKISRQTPGSLVKTEISVNLKEVAKLNQEDILLQPNDVVDVPGPKRNFWKDLFRGIIPAVTRIPVIIP